MARSSRHSFLIGVRPLPTCFAAFPIGFLVWLCLFYFGVPRLLKVDNVIPNYIGFYIRYPNLVGRVNNLQCTADPDGIVAHGFFYFCRFNVKSETVEQFVNDMELSPESPCGRVYQNTPRGRAYQNTPQEHWWNPSETMEGQCYFRDHADPITLRYSPTDQAAYIIDYDY